MCAMVLALTIGAGLFAVGAPTAYSGDCIYLSHIPENDYERAGHPNCVFRWAIPTYTPCYSACYVGGGAPFEAHETLRGNQSCTGGEPRYVHEGTWGRDYSGILFPKKIWLSWYHGNRYQGGSGAYKTDGPHCLKCEEE